MLNLFELERAAASEQGLNDFIQEHFGMGHFKSQELFDGLRRIGNQTFFDAWSGPAADRVHEMHLEIVQRMIAFNAGSIAFASTTRAAARSIQEILAQARAEYDAAVEALNKSRFI